MPGVSEEQSGWSGRKGVSKGGVVSRSRGQRSWRAREV